MFKKKKKNNKLERDIAILIFVKFVNCKLAN